MKTLWKVKIFTEDGAEHVAENVGPYDEDDEGILQTALDELWLKMSDVVQWSYIPQSEEWPEVVEEESTDADQLPIDFEGVDWLTPTAECLAEPETFWVLERIGSKAPWYAKLVPVPNLEDSFFLTTTGDIEKAATWPSLAAAEEFMDEYSIELDGKFRATEHQEAEGGAHG